MRYEKHTQALISPAAFALRVLRHVGAAAGVLLAFLFLGMLGYHYLGSLSWLDSFLNAAMILSGMGPVAELTSSAAKLFAGVYALLSGLVFAVILGIVIAPMLHRVLHRMHLGAGNGGE